MDKHPCGDRRDHTILKGVGYCKACRNTGFNYPGGPVHKRDMTNNNLLLKSFEAKFIECAAEKAEVDADDVALAESIAREVAQLDEAGRVEFTHRELMALLDILNSVANGHYSDSHSEKVLAKAISTRIANEFWDGDARKMERDLRSYEFNA